MIPRYLPVLGNGGIVLCALSLSNNRQKCRHEAVRFTRHSARDSDSMRHLASESALARNIRTVRVRDSQVRNMNF